MVKTTLEIKDEVYRKLVEAAMEKYGNTKSISKMTNKKNKLTPEASVCFVCEKGILIEVDNIISEIEGYVFVEKGQRCTDCGEEFIREKDAQRTIEIAKKLGIWPQPLKLHRSLSKSGRGLVLRIPSDLEKDFKLKSGESVSISKVGSKIVIEPED